MEPLPEVYRQRVSAISNLLVIPAEAQLSGGNILDCFFDLKLTREIVDYRIETQHQEY